MREIKRDRLIDDTDILLFDILQELKKMNNPFIVPYVSTYPDIITQGTLVTTTGSGETKPTKTYKCKYCGGEHEQPWEIARCGKNKQKGGAK